MTALSTISIFRAGIAEATSSRVTLRRSRPAAFHLEALDDNPHAAGNLAIQSFNSFGRHTAEASHQPARRHPRAGSGRGRRTGHAVGGGAINSTQMRRMRGGRAMPRMRRGASQAGGRTCTARRPPRRKHRSHPCAAAVSRCRPRSAPSLNRCSSATSAGSASTPAAKRRKQRARFRPGPLRLDGISCLAPVNMNRKVRKDAGFSPMN